MKKFIFLITVFCAFLAIQTKAQFGSVIKELNLKIPADFNSDTQIDAFKDVVIKEKNTYNYDKELTSKNLSKTTHKLVSGEIYTVKFFPIIVKWVSGDMCLDILNDKDNPATLVGFPGIIELYKQFKDQLPKDKWFVSPDIKDNLYVNYTGHVVPFLHTYSDGDYAFEVNYWEYDWSDNCIIVAFYLIK